MPSTDLPFQPPATTPPISTAPVLAMAMLPSSDRASILPTAVVMGLESSPISPVACSHNLPAVTFVTPEAAPFRMRPRSMPLAVLGAVRYAVRASPPIPGPTRTVFSVSAPSVSAI